METNKVHSDLPIPPGEYLLEVLEESGLTTVGLARQLALTTSELARLLSGESAVTQSIAQRLAEIVGVPAHIWLGLEEEYRRAMFYSYQERLTA